MDVHLRLWCIFVLICCLESFGDSASSHTFHFRNPSTVGTRGTNEDKHGFTPAPKVIKPHRDICKGEAVCVAPVQCPAHMQGAAPTECHTLGGRMGVCCTTGHNHTGPIAGDKSRTKLLNKRIHIDSAMMNSIARHSRMEIHELQVKEARLMTSRMAIVPKGTASFGHFRNSKIFRNTDLVEVMGVATKALEIALATRAFKDRQGLSNQQIELGMMDGDLRPSPLGSACTSEQSCPPVPSRYRNIDATCNNLHLPSWGSTLSPYARLLPPSYQDGIWAPRVSEDHGQPLSSPRLISTTLFQDLDVPEVDYTLMIMQLGQFISHDVTQTIDTTFTNGSGISCCSEDGTNELPPQFRHFACYPIQISRQDPFFGDFEQGCMNFVRSVLAPNHDCSLGYAQQMNKVTHLLDGSAVYGSSAESSGELRAFEGGLMSVFNDFNRELPPLNTDPEACLTSEQGSACFTSGDSRTNQMVSLVVIHLLFLREHNRVARALGSINPHWGDEDIYSEARHIVIAELQNIIFKEFLPIVLGPDAMDEFELSVMSPDYSNIYDPSVEPSVTNEFAAAAFRFGHSTVDGTLRLWDRSKMEEAIDIPEIMFHPSRMRKRPFYDEVLNTLTTEPIQRVDNGIADALTKYMFRAGNPFGIDLASINIQRGRDHGLRPYNDYRELVGLPRMMHFEEYGSELGAALNSVYANVDDVDLWVGGLLEPKYPGSIVGLTFRDIIADQFSRLRRGDRYFYDLHPSINPGAFTPEQLNEIKKSSMSRLVCDNRDGIMLARQAPNAFRKPGVPGNEFVDCDHPMIPSVNLNYWKEFM